MFSVTKNICRFERTFGLNQVFRQTIIRSSIVKDKWNAHVHDYGLAGIVNEPAELLHSKNRSDSKNAE